MTRFLLATVLPLSWALSHEAWTMDPPKPVTPLVQSGNAFAIDLYGVLRSGEGNRFFSSFSIYSALAMTYAARRMKPRYRLPGRSNSRCRQLSFTRRFTA